jgi:hypothetical protein
MTRRRRRGGSTTPAVISAVSAANQGAGGDVAVTYTIDKTSAVKIAIGTQSTKYTAAEITGETATGAVAYISDTWSTSGSTTPTIPSGIAAGSYYLHVLPSGGGDSDVVVTGSSFTLDTTAPSLSSPGSSSLADTTATISVTSNEASGTLYGGVWPTASTPSAADIIAGTGATFHDTDASPTAGVNNFSATGLTAETDYKAHFVQVDAVDNESSVSTSAEFTTTAASGTTITYGTGDVSGSTGLSSSLSYAVDMSGHNGTDDVLVVFGIFGGADTTVISDLTLDGNANASLTSQTVGSSNGVATGFAVFSGTSFAASSTLAYTSNTNFYDAGSAVYFIPAGSTVAQLTSQSETTRAGSTLSGNVADGDAVVGAQMTTGGGVTTWTGLTEDYDADARSNEYFTAASASDVSAATPRTITTSTTSAKTAGISVKVN